VAVKLLNVRDASPRSIESFERESIALGALSSHPNIVTLYRTFRTPDGRPVLVLELCTGVVADRLRGGTGLPVTDAVSIGIKIAGALETAHRGGILHRDVKPQNILLDPDGRARLTDFGSAKLDGQLGVTGSGTLAGTLAYTAPEVLAGRRGDARADVYALGLTLYYALTGDLPARGSPHLPPTSSPEGFRPRPGAPAAPAWLDDVVAHATAAAAEDRFPTAASLDEALARPGAAAGLLMNGAGACVLCAGPDPLALGLCPACGGSTEAADTLVFLRREARPSDRRAAALRLARALPEMDRASAQAAAVGERPVFRVPRAGVQRLVQELERRDVAVRTVPASRAWSVLPAKAWLTAGAAVTAGTVAGAAMPFLLWTSPIIGSLVLIGARRDARTPLVSPPSREASLPAALERTVIETLVALPAGTARGLLADIVRASDALFATLAREGDQRGIAPSLEELVTAACRAAADLSDLDENLARFERQRERLAAAAPERLDALTRSERTRDALVQRLLEAMTAVARLRTQQVELAQESDSTLGDLADELRRETEAQAAASRELEALLGR